MSNSDTKKIEDQLGLASILMATPDPKGYWPTLFKEAGIKIHVVDDVDEFSIRIETAPPPVLMIDLSIDAVGLAAIRDAYILKSMDASMHLVGLVDTEVEAPDEVKITDAFELGAQDFLMRGVLPDVLAQRVKFMYRHAITLQRMTSSDRSVLDNLREGQAHWIWDQEKDLVYVSDPMRFIMKAKPDARLITMDMFLGHFSDQQRNAFERAIEKVKQDGVPSRLFQIFSAGELKGAVEHILIDEKSTTGGLPRIRGVARLREDQEKHRKVLFSRDRMTGLPNQEGLLVALDNILGLQKKKDNLYENGFVGLIVVDIDRFKRIAAVYGRQASDEAVKLVAKRLKQFIIEPTQQAREAAQKGDKSLLAKSKAVYLSCLGRDEFAFLMTGLDRVDLSAQLAGRIIKAFDKPFVIDGNEIYLTSSMGVTIAPVDGENGEDLLKNARGALAQAKNQPTTGYQFFSPALATSSKERLEIETLLRQAIDEEKLTLKYQPQVDIKTGKITGVEALARWDHPEYGAMSPATFVAIAEEVGIITDLGNWVLRQSIKDAQYFNAQGEKLQLSVNISTGMFTSGKLHNLIVKILKDTKFAPSQLTLEITEGLIMKDIDQAAEIMKLLKERGVKMALDDFGTGYSSLSYLKTLPFDTIKIDRSFVSDMVDNPDGTAMIRAIMDISKSLKIKVTAEGVELKEQLEMLTREGCSHYQGFYCSGPIKREDLLTMIKAGNANNTKFN
jgi:predicted signal transduction protein with EAL and GGDEF domain